jgi:hypothetical protein
MAFGLSRPSQLPPAQTIYIQLRERSEPWILLKNYGKTSLDMKRMRLIMRSTPGAADRKPLCCERSLKTNLLANALIWNKLIGLPRLSSFSTD